MLSLFQNYVHPDWKLGVVTPLFKEGDPTNPSNYRPISVLPSISKLLERLVHNQLYKFLDVFQILANEQSGFRKGYSTGTCMVDLLGRLYQAMERPMDSELSVQ